MDLTARALLLDMDGTLVDSGAVVMRVWGRWAAAHGLSPERVEEVVHGRQGHESMAILLPGRPTAENVADNARMLAEETADLDGIVPIPGAPAFLAALAGVPHALVTSADVALSTGRMGAAGLALPEVRITAEDVSASKPDPEGFLKGAAELGFAPEDCVVFEDSAAGVAAGLAAGMRVVGVGAATAAYGATVTVDTLEQVAVLPRPDGSVTLRIG
ncbi:HAD-IA family hydrolase [Streptacidiphilus rugosus]|uniref:HAD-IA family hydrolase n=1 Tax=Streptacidiphilus rugosus TaxID=405783 RepID=UPI0005689369|nr:HAD-IA family hydrolase [Streptacidiphilus rugosus]